MPYAFRGPVCALENCQTPNKTPTVSSAHCCVFSRYQVTRSSLVDPSGLQRARHNIYAVTR
jgi:hypothetical protein